MKPYVFLTFSHLQVAKPDVFLTLWHLQVAKPYVFLTLWHLQVAKPYVFLTLWHLQIAKPYVFLSFSKPGVTWKLHIYIKTYHFGVNLMPPGQPGGNRFKINKIPLENFLINFLFKTYTSEPFWVQLPGSLILKVHGNRREVQK